MLKYSTNLTSHSYIQQLEVSDLPLAGEVTIVVYQECQGKFRTSNHYISVTPNQFCIIFLRVHIYIDTP